MTATVVRSEMSVVRGKPAYASGLEFDDSRDNSPAVIRDIVAWLTKEAAKNSVAAAPVPEPVLESVDEPEILSAQYLQCLFIGGKWIKVYVGDPAQPGDGFTIVTPSNESEADVLCRAYEKAGPQARRAMRASFAQAISQKKG
jgi:hypothetical protein